jgi:hypothetical protein
MHFGGIVSFVALGSGFKHQFSGSLLLVIGAKLCLACPHCETLPCNEAFNLALLNNEAAPNKPVHATCEDARARWPALAISRDI